MDAPLVRGGAAGGRPRPGAPRGALTADRARGGPGPGQSRSCQPAPRSGPGTSWACCVRCCSRRRTSPRQGRSRRAPPFPGRVPHVARAPVRRRAVRLTSGCCSSATRCCAGVRSTGPAGSGSGPTAAHSTSGTVILPPPAPDCSQAASNSWRRCGPGGEGVRRTRRTAGAAPVTARVCPVPSAPAAGRRCDRTEPSVSEALLLAELTRLRAQEVERGVTLVGPHRDDLVLTLGEFPAQGYASHGESWSLALALRLACWETSAGGRR